MCLPCLSLISKLNDWEGPCITLMLHLQLAANGRSSTYMHIYNYTYTYLYVKISIFTSSITLLFQCKRFSLLTATSPHFLVSHTYLGLFILLYTGIHAMQINQSNPKLYCLCGSHHLSSHIIFLIFHIYEHIMCLCSTYNKGCRIYKII